MADLRSIAGDTMLHGLPPETSALAALDRLQAASRHDAVAAAALDVAADALFRRLALEFGQGAADPSVADPDWTIPRAAVTNVDQLLALVRSAPGVGVRLNAELPSDSEYRALEAELGRVIAESHGATDANGLTREQRLDRLRASLERLRWLPRDMPARRIDVLVPFFTARVAGFGASSEHRVIVGVRSMPTPTFAASIESVTLNPSWSPPSSIVSAELLPRFRRNPAAASAEGFEAFDASGQRVDPASVNWSARPFPYILRQRPGARNALGRVRFDMPNPFSIYVHDTPSRGLFERSDRALSHGCIRVEAPVDLAARVLGDPVWSTESLQAAIDAGGTQTIRLAEPLPIYIVYLTAAADADGVIHYASDIYGRDRLVLEMLDYVERTPTAAAGPGAVRCAG